MARDLAIGNGSLLINFDQQYNLADLYYPHVGKYNHTNGAPSRFGVWVDGRFSWISDDGWKRELHYETHTLITSVIATNQDLGLELHCRDMVDFDRTLYVKQVEVRNMQDAEREVRLFFHLDPHFYSVAIGDTVYVEPRHRALVAYKDRCYLWLNGQIGETIGLSSYATGTKGAHGQEGTWRDAEDGVLSRHPIAQGSVDAVGALHISVPALGSATAFFWLAVGESYDEVDDLAGQVGERGPEHYVKRTRDYWRLWVNKAGESDGSLPDDIADLYRRSLLIVRTQIDDDGAIVAANDAEGLRFGRDTYSYVWPRDGALVARALILAGYPGTTRSFFHFCASVIRPEGYFLHKYTPDGSPGSSWHPWVAPDGELQLPIQEDETALVIYALWLFYDRTRDVEFIKPFYRTLIRNAADFLVRYRDPGTWLPLPSYDLWEERHGIHTFTVATVYAALRAAAAFTDLFGDEQLSQTYRTAAAEVRAAALQHLYMPDKGRFARRAIVLVEGAETTLQLDATVDASLCALVHLEFLDIDDPRLRGTLEAVEQRLWCRTSVGGIARYENDYYYRQSSDVARIPGNPWPICTLWLAEWYIARARREQDLQPALELLHWVCRWALPSGTIAEQFDPETGRPLSVSPLTWSHSAFVATVQCYREQQKKLRAEATLTSALGAFTPSSAAG